MSVEMTTIQRAETLEALTRGEIDIQIATAKRYPREVQLSVDRIRSLATQNQETAQECFYALRRGDQTISGPSVRLAEIVAANWGNLRVQSFIISNDGKFITARGICHDLETNVAMSSDVQRRITDRNGKTYNDDMQVMAGNAAGAIAFRNAVFKVVPKALIASVIKDIQEASLGRSVDLEDTRNKMFKYFASIGVTEEMVLSYMEVDSVEKIGKEEIIELRGTVTGIKEGTLSAKECFIDPFKAKQATKIATEKATDTKSRVAQALARQNAPQEDDDLPLGND